MPCVVVTTKIAPVVLPGRATREPVGEPLHVDTAMRTSGLGRLCGRPLGAISWRMCLAISFLPLLLSVSCWQIEQMSVFRDSCPSQASRSVFLDHQRPVYRWPNKWWVKESDSRVEPP
jgi:hypothetical protein